MVLLATAAVTAMALTACGGSDTQSGSGSGSSQSSGGDGFTFTSGSTVIEMNADASAVVDELGEADDYFESESCAFEGLTRCIHIRASSLILIRWMTKIMSCPLCLWMIQSQLTKESASAAQRMK